MKKLILLISFVILAQFGLENTLVAQNLVVSSPNQRIKVTVDISDQISWSTSLDKMSVIENSTISLNMGKGRILGLLPKLKNTKTEFFSKEIIPQIPSKDAKILSQYNQLIMNFHGNYELIFRAYDDGISCRFVDKNKQSSMVFNEELNIKFPENSSSFFHRKNLCVPIMNVYT